MKNPWILEHPSVGVAYSCGTVLEIVNEKRAREMELQWQTASSVDWKARQLTDEEVVALRASGYTSIKLPAYR